MSCAFGGLSEREVLMKPCRLAVANLISVVTILPILAAVLSFVSAARFPLYPHAVLNTCIRSPMGSVAMTSMSPSSSRHCNISTYVHSP